MYLPITKKLNSGLLSILETNERAGDYIIDLNVLRNYLDDDLKVILLDHINKVKEEIPASLFVLFKLAITSIEQEV